MMCSSIAGREYICTAALCSLDNPLRLAPRDCQQKVKYPINVSYNEQTFPDGYQTHGCHGKAI